MHHGITLRQQPPSFGARPWIASNNFMRPFNSPATDEQSSGCRNQRNLKIVVRSGTQRRRTLSKTFRRSPILHGKCTKASPDDALPIRPTYRREAGADCLTSIAKNSEKVAKNNHWCIRVICIARLFKGFGKNQKATITSLIHDGAASPPP